VLLMQLSVISWPLISEGRNGPLFDLIYLNHTGNCINNGWKEVLMTANFLPLNETCIIFNWFVSMDFQMFILSLLLIMAINKSLPLGIVVSLTQIVVGLVLHFIQIGWSPPPHSLVPTEEEELLTQRYATKYTHPFGYI